jgi:hypothetical protein
MESRSSNCKLKVKWPRKVLGKSCKLNYEIFCVNTKRIQKLLNFNLKTHGQLLKALRKNPVRNNPERKNTETRQNPEHIHKSRIPTGAEKAQFFPPLTSLGRGEGEGKGSIGILS